jgi:hypothetical protein
MADPKLRCFMYSGYSHERLRPAAVYRKPIPRKRPARARCCEAKTLQSRESPFADLPQSYRRSIYVREEQIESYRNSYRVGVS